MEKLKNILLYGGLTKEQYDLVRPHISEDNRNHIKYFSLLGCIPFAAILLLDFRQDSWWVSASYGGMIVFLLLFYLIAKTAARDNPTVTTICANLFSFLLPLFGLLNAYFAGDQRTTILLPYFLFSAVLFCIRPVCLLCAVLITEAMYIPLMQGIQSAAIYRTNVINTLLFCFLSIFVGLHLLTKEHEKFYVHHMNRYLLEHDQLTGLYNRRSYEQTLDNVAQNKAPVTICIFDVNSLKTVNDTIGHEAGDELLIAAANCIEKNFSPYGKVFRIGGDEFAAILHGELFHPEAVVTEFQSAQKAWHGIHTHTLSIAFGMAALNSDFQQMLRDTVRKADAMMYQDKMLYYSLSGNDRRRKQTAASEQNKAE